MARFDRAISLCGLFRLHSFYLSSTYLLQTGDLIVEPSEVVA